MKTSQLAHHLRGLSETLSPHLPGSASAAVANMRRHALERLSETGLPRITDEAWRYTNIRAFEKSAFRPTGEAYARINDATLAALDIPSLDCYRIVLVNGWVNETCSTLDALPKGVECIRLKDSLDNPAESRAIQLLEARTNHAEHGFEALNSAIAADGIILNIAAGIKLDKPIELLHISQYDADTGLSNINHFVSLAQGAKIDLIERYVSTAATTHMTNASIGFNLAESGEVNHYRIQDESCRALHVGYTTARQHQSSRYRIFSVSTGALLNRHEVKQNLEGQQAQGEMKGLYIGNGNQHIDNYTTVVHASPNATSDEFYKGILAERGRAVFHGRIKVNPDAQHTDAQQQNKNLLLSTNAEADTKPQLEIYADDVKCSHGATVGYLESDAIFYLRSRGLDEADARAMLTEAFALEIIEQIEHAPVREHLVGLLREKLANTLDYREAA